MKTELLAPARDLECGIAAIDCGADAVYIGAPRFGARAAVGNTLEDIAALARYAHKYWARVYATLNTLLFDAELPEAERLAWHLHDAGVDALIIQDMGLLEGNLPPLPLVASTQMHNHTPERVAFLERVGFRRAILARELDLAQIRAIREAAPAIELECFVHGALCVCYSGQCCLSYALGGRSGNRGECAQPCRKPYTLIDAGGRVLVRDRHLLSTRDLNLSGCLAELLAAGVASFKIEGRLKDRAYVRNVVAYYRARLDEAGAERSSSGVSAADFTPDVAKTFNRGFTTYFLHGRTERVGSHSTPKMAGEEVGRVTKVESGRVMLDTAVALHPGDGLCFFDRHGALRGTSVNRVDGCAIVPDKADGLEAGTLVCRNHDREFLTSLSGARVERRIPVRFAVHGDAHGVILRVTDEGGVCAEVSTAGPFEAARDSERAAATVRRALEKTGETEFRCVGVESNAAAMPFLPVSAWNALRREALERLSAERASKRPRETGGVTPSDTPFPAAELSYFGNVLNAKAEAFYRRHGVVRIERAAESGLDLNGRKVMSMRYCLKQELGMCPREGHSGRIAEPLALIDEQGRRLELRFDCKRCEMEVWLGSGCGAAWQAAAGW